MREAQAKHFPPHKSIKLKDMHEKEYTKTKGVVLEFLHDRSARGLTVY